MNTFFRFSALTHWRGVILELSKLFASRKSELTLGKTWKLIEAVQNLAQPESVVFYLNHHQNKLNMPRKNKDKLDEKEETKEEMWARHKQEKEDDIMRFMASLIVNLLANQTEEEYQRMMIKLRARMVADELKKLPKKPYDNEDEKRSSDKN